MTNGEWIAEKKLFYKWIIVDCGGADGVYKITSPDGITVRSTGESSANAVLNWLDMEHKEKILTDKEKAYLAALIEPFKADVIIIEKSDYDIWEGIRITVRRDDNFDIIALPRFQKGSMYKNMKLNRQYKVEELGL